MLAPGLDRIGERPVAVRREIDELALGVALHHLVHERASVTKNPGQFTLVRALVLVAGAGFEPTTSGL